MKVINSSRRLPENQLNVIAAAGWIGVLYLCWVIGQDSWERTMFSFGAMAGEIPELDPFNERYRTNPRLTLLHTIPGILFAVLGPLQFMGPVRRAVPTLHRWSGRVFATIGVISGVGAFWMTFQFPIWGMSANLAISGGFSVLMVYAFIRAVALARAKKFIPHREWMIRGFAIGIGVAYFRVMLNDVLPWMGVEDFTTRWDIVTASSQAITLGLAELWIRATRPAAKSLQPKAQPAAAAT